MAELQLFIDWLVEFINQVGYPGLFLAMFLGNVMVPIPVELTMIPAGYLVQQHEMNLVWVLVSTVAGDVCGSLCGYYFAAQFGRKFFMKYGKYIFLRPEKIEFLQRFFRSHGEISVLTGRLTPGLRHFMAFPAGLAHMDVRKFCLYTGAGGAVWSAVLIGVGYLIGGNKALVKHYMPVISYVTLLLVAIGIFFYVRNHRRKQAKG